MFRSLLENWSNIGCDLITGEYTRDIDRINSFVNGSAIQGAPSLNSLPGTLSGPDDLDRSIARNISYTLSDLNTTLVISAELLDGRSLRQRLLILDLITLVNTDEKNALAFSRADDRILP